MEGIFGLAAFGFWMFVAAAAVAGIWDGVRKREAEHETLRRMIEAPAGEPGEDDVLDQLRLRASGRTRTWWTSCSGTRRSPPAISRSQGSSFHSLPPGWPSWA